MSETVKKPADRRPTAAEERAERLAAALRANLRRRKDQARGRETAAVDRQDDLGPDAGSDDSRS
ncbi:MAG: hypothetical protein GX458_16780 [Phyllobacteriaceae bacterium]|nr:hypothetical protein [Phyllobacteriaceae bacterium]